jgi:hypothetical protein
MPLSIVVLITAVVALFTRGGATIRRDASALRAPRVRQRAAERSD